MKVVLYLVLGIFAISLLFYLVADQKGANVPTSEKPEDKDLAGNVNFDGFQFHITNQEDKDWRNCWFQVNGKYKYPTDPTSMRLDGIKAGEKVSITGGEFTLKDGTRFNSLETKPNDFTASCDNRFGYWSWN